MTALFAALFIIGFCSAVFCHVRGDAAFSRMVAAHDDADSDACEAEWKRWRRLQGHISLGVVVLVCALSQILG